MNFCSQAADLSKPVDKKIYKGTNPTCHDFNTVTTTYNSVSLLIGFSTGQIQIFDPIKKEISKLYNEEVIFSFYPSSYASKESYYMFQSHLQRLIDKTRVTCIRWVPGSCNLFLAAHASGQLYVYNEELGCGTAAPHYQPFKQGEGYAIHTCKTKSTRNPLYRWVIGAEGCCINEFAFSPCGAHLAVVSQDGFLRVFHYDTMELIGHARSYFGGFLCVCWSPDGRYVVVGGEDDLVTVWSFNESRVVARGQGHRSWVSVVAFDPYTCCLSENDNGASTGSDEELRVSTTDHPGVCYRLGSVSQDTQLCLWDITEDVLRPPPKSRVSAHLSTSTRTSSTNGVVNKPPVKCLKNNKIGLKVSDSNVVSSSSHSTVSNKSNVESSGNGTNTKIGNKTAKVNNLSTVNITVGGCTPASESGPLSAVTQRLAGFTFGDRKDHSHRRNFSLTSKSGNSSNSDSKNNSISNSVALRVKSTLVGGGVTNTCGGCGAKGACDPLRLIGTAACPRFDDCPVLEPLVCKKVAHERLTALLFREDCLLTACQDGGVYTWARPGLPSSSNDAPDASHVFERDRRFEHIDMYN